MKPECMLSRAYPGNKWMTWIIAIADNASSGTVAVRIQHSGIRKRVVPRVKSYLAEDSNVLLTNDYSCVRTRSGILEVFPDGSWVRSDSLGSGSPKHCLRVIHADDGLGVSAVIRGLPRPRSYCNLVVW